MKQSNFPFVLGTSFAALLLAGCAHVDTGQVDYRIAEDPSADRLDCRGTNCDPQSPAPLLRRYLPPGATSPTQQQISNDHYYSINLEQAAIGSRVLEGVIFGDDFGARFLNNRAEIAILAKVFEFGTSSTGAPGFVENVSGEINRSSTLDGNTNEESDPLSGLRLIYYSGDVEPGQMLNFSNVPLLTLRQYKGRSVGIQIVVVEIDGENAASTALLSRLAEFGQQISPTSGPVLPLLSQLGQSFASGASGDDILLDYRFVLSSNSAENGRAPTLRPGRYVMRRTQNRRRPMQWGDLCLDHNTGRLYRRLGAERTTQISNTPQSAENAVTPKGKGNEPSVEENELGEELTHDPYTGGNACGPWNDDRDQSHGDPGTVSQFEEVRDELYMTFRVDYHGDQATPEFINQQEWTAFRSRVRTLSEDRGRPIDEVFNATEQLITQYRSQRWRSDLTERWSNARRALNRYEEVYVSEAQLGAGEGSLGQGVTLFDKGRLDQCGVTALTVRARRDRAEAEARSALVAFFERYQEALKDKKKETPGTPQSGQDVAVTDDAAPAQGAEDKTLVFGASDRANILSALTRFFLPWSDESLKTGFESVGAFETTYLAEEPGRNFVNDALGHAKWLRDQDPHASCSDLGYSRQ